MGGIIFLVLMIVIVVVMFKTCFEFFIEILGWLLRLGWRMLIVVVVILILIQAC